MNIFDVNNLSDSEINYYIAKIDGWYLNKDNLFEKETIDETIILKNKFEPLFNNKQALEILKRENIIVNKTKNGNYGILVFKHKNIENFILETDSYIKSGLLFFICKKLNIISF